MNTTKNWIKTTLSKFPFVEFDRFIDDTDDKLIEVFGWIKDDRWEEEFAKLKKRSSFEMCNKGNKMVWHISSRIVKAFIRNIRKQDFIVLEFNLKTKEVYCIATSSAKYSKQISKILGEKHINCQLIKDL